MGQHADEQAIMDPAASPIRAAVRSGVRRMNNAPITIVAGAIAAFFAIMAGVAAGRASERDSEREQTPIRSALGIAKDVAGDREAGVIAPASATDARAGAAPAAAAAASATHEAAGSIPPPPQRPELLEGVEGSKEAPELSQPTSAGMQSSVSSGTAPAAANAQTEEERDLRRMQLEMFKEAIRSPSTAKSALPEAREGGEPSAAERVAEVREQLDALRSLHGASGSGSGGGYVDKLRELQEAGLLPEEQARDARPTGDYERFAGDAKEDRWTLGSAQEAPESPYELRAGAVLPATLQTGINSDLPGQITAIVAQDVRDTARGQYVLIPQGSRLVGTYGADVKFGQERVLVAWQRVIWPDGKVLDIGAMPGADGAGYAGFKDLVDTHFWRILGSALLLSGITGGIAYSQDSQAQDKVTVGGSMSQALGQQLGQLSEEMIRKQMNVAPTIEIRPGYRFNVQVTKDLTFNGPYQPFDYERSITADGKRHRGE